MSVQKQISLFGPAVWPVVGNIFTNIDRYNGIPFTSNKRDKRAPGPPCFHENYTPPPPLNIVVTAQVKSIKCFPGGRIYMSL